MSKPVNFTAGKVLLYEDWLSIAAFTYNMMMGNFFDVPKKEVLDEIEKAYLEYQKRKEMEVTDHAVYVP